MTEDSPAYTVTPAPAPVAAPAEYVEAPPAKKAFLAALAKAQGEFDAVIKNKTANIRPRDADKTPYTFSYADLGEILRAVRPALAANGLSTRSKIVPGEGSIWLQSILAHSEGWEDICELPLNIEVKDIKELGIRIAYLRRYLKVAHVDIAGEDDADVDGEGAEDRGYSTTGNRTPAPAPRRAPQPRAPKPGTLRAEIAAPAQQTPATPDDATTAANDEPPADAEPPAENGNPISGGQAKWVVAKLGAYFTPEESEAWLKQRGIAKVEQIPASRFEALKSELVAL